MNKMEQIGAALKVKLDQKSDKTSTYTKSDMDVALGDLSSSVVALSNTVNVNVVDFDAMQMDFGTLKDNFSAKLVEFAQVKADVENVLASNTTLLSTVATIGTELANDNSVQSTILNAMAANTDAIVALGARVTDLEDALTDIASAL